MASKKERDRALSLSREIEGLEARLAHHEHRRDVKRARLKNKVSSARRDHAIAVLHRTIREKEAFR